MQYNWESSPVFLIKTLFSVLCVCSTVMYPSTPHPHPDLSLGKVFSYGMMTFLYWRKQFHISRAEFFDPGYYHTVVIFQFFLQISISPLPKYFPKIAGLSYYFLLLKLMFRCSWCYLFLLPKTLINLQSFSSIRLFDCSLPLELMN